jgi:signal transduction histidine kinase
VKHSGAAAASVAFAADEEQATLCVSDDGRGFSVADPARRVGLGLLNMHERLRPFAGDLRIQSTPGAGTQLCAAVPLRRQKAGPASARGIARAGRLHKDA